MLTQLRARSKKIQLSIPHLRYEDDRYANPKKQSGHVDVLEIVIGEPSRDGGDDDSDEEKNKCNYGSIRGRKNGCSLAEEGGRNT